MVPINVPSLLDLSNLIFSTIVLSLNLLRCSILIDIVPNIMIANRMQVSLRRIISGGHALVEDAVLRTDTAGEGVITLLFFVILFS